MNEFRAVLVIVIVVLDCTFISVRTMLLVVMYVMLQLQHVHVLCISKLCVNQAGVCGDHRPQNFAIRGSITLYAYALLCLGVYCVYMGIIHHVIHIY